jgi:ABC-type antimicrobial peptide transport system ATPase subunit
MNNINIQVKCRLNELEVETQIQVIRLINHMAKHKNGSVLFSRIIRKAKKMIDDETNLSDSDLSDSESESDNKLITK